MWTFVPLQHALKYNPEQITTFVPVLSGLEHEYQANKMMLFGLCFSLYFLKLSRDNGFLIQAHLQIKQRHSWGYTLSKG